MRKIILLILLAFSNSIAFSTGGDNDYILTEKTCFHFKKVRYGIGPYLVGYSKDGKKHKILLSNVIKFKKSGYLYEKVPLINNYIKSKVYDFMKVICRRDEMTLYEYKHRKMKNKTEMRYYVFRNNHFVVELCGHRDADLLAKFISVN